MKSWFTQRFPPPLTPPYQRSNWSKKREQHSSKRKPSPEITHFSSVGKGEIAYNEGEAAGEVEEDAGFGGLRLVAVGDVGI